MALKREVTAQHVCLMDVRFLPPKQQHQHQHSFYTGRPQLTQAGWVKSHRRGFPRPWCQDDPGCTNSILKKQTPSQQQPPHGTHVFHHAFFSHGKNSSLHVRLIQSGYRCAIGVVRSTMRNINNPQRGHHLSQYGENNTQGSAQGLSALWMWIQSRGRVLSSGREDWIEGASPNREWRDAATATRQTWSSKDCTKCVDCSQYLHILAQLSHFV